MRMRRTTLPLLLALLLVFVFGLFPAFAYAEDPTEAPDATEEAFTAEPEAAPETEPELEPVVEPQEAPELEPEEAVDTADSLPSEEPPVLSTAATTVSNIPLYDIDGTTSTLNDLYGGTYRVVIVGRPTCGNTQYTVRRALALSQVADYDEVNFLVMDIDGDFDAFKEGFGETETDRVRFYSSDDRTYNTWAWTYLNASGTITLPITMLINDRDEVVYTTTGPQQLYDIISEYFNIGSDSADLTLYDIDGTTTTMTDRYGGTNRIVIVGRPACLNTQRTVGGALTISTMEEYQSVNFLVLDIDGDRATFQEGFGSMETDRVRFYSSNDYTYSRWAMDAYRTIGLGTDDGITLPIIVLMDENDEIVAVETGPTSVVDLCKDYFQISNPYVTSVDVRGYADTQQCRELLGLVNEARAAVGVDPLVWDADLAACAMQRAAETAVYFDHTRPDGTTCFTAWPSWALSGAENIAAGQEDVQTVNTSWTNSSGHYHNMINADMASFGAALYVNDAGEPYWVECFSGEIGPAGEGTFYAEDWTTSVSVDTSVVKVGNLPTTVNLEAGMTHQLDKPTLGDVNLADPTVTWSTSDPSVATVDQNGLITAVYPGEAMITATLANNPKLTATVGVAVGGRSIQYASVYFEGYSSTFTYTGSPITPALTVKSLGIALTEGKDYTLEYQNNTQVGTASIVITGMGAYKGSKTVTFTIVEPPVLTDISGAAISAIDDQAYEGFELQPTFTVTLDGVELRKGTDYTVRYADNVEIGTAYVYVDGIGSYTGTASTTFQIVEEQEDDGIFIGLVDIDYEYYQTYTGNPVKPKIVATYEGEQLVEGRDYILSYKDNVECGTGKIIVTGIGRFFHEWHYLFQISMPSTKTDISRATIDEIYDYVYEGAPIEPSVWVRLDGELLWEGNDYEVSYANNNAVGTATVTITGIGDYEGSISTTFRILAPEPPEPAVSFRDVTAKTPHADDIAWLAESGISTGWTEKDGTKTFRPANTVVRQDMAAFLFRLAKLWGLVDESWQPTGSVTFTDVNESTPHYREIMWLAESGISAGWKVGSGREFRPRNTVVRQDMAAFLRRLQALRDPSVKTWKPTGASPFRDVTSSTPHSEDILWLAESGVSAGWKVGGTKEFRPTNTVIRQDMAAFLHRLDSLG